MKIRNGFVSNSSSSSFVVVMKNNQKLTKEKLLEVFEVNEDSPLYEFAFDLAEFTINNVEEKSIKDLYKYYLSSKNVPEEQMIEELKEEGFLLEYIDDIVQGKIKYYLGSVDSDSGWEEPINGYLYNKGIDIETEDIQMFIEG